DSKGNLNASRFGNRVSGCGGVINISQNHRKISFVGTFTSGGRATEIADGRLRIAAEGRHRKFVERVGQVTFNGPLAAEEDRDVLFITERCVFRLGPEGLRLTEIAPGIDLERDVLALMPFRPV